MHLTASGLPALGCEMHQTPSALCFPTQLPGSILIPITKLKDTRRHEKIKKIHHQLRIFGKSMYSTKFSLVSIKKGVVNAHVCSDSFFS